MHEARAVVFAGPGKPLEFRSIPLPAPARGEVLLAVTLATICGSDLHTIEGRRTEPTPSVLGHEGVGTVIAVGPERDPALVGRRVTWTIADSCGCCRPCVDWELPQKCETLFKYGHASLNSGTGLNGCYSTHVVLRRGTTVIPIPDSISDALAAPVNCALATMCAAIERLPNSGGTAVIQGGGLLGLYGSALLRTRGWKRVIVVEARQDRLSWIRPFGGEPVSALDSGGIPSGTVDAVLETAGNPSVVAEGIRMVRGGGDYVWVGMVHPQSAVELTGESVIRKCLTIRGVHNYGPRHLKAAVDFLAAHVGDFPWSQLVSPPFPLERMDEAIELAKTGEWPRVSVLPGICEVSGVSET